MSKIVTVRNWQATGELERRFQRFKDNEENILIDWYAAEQKKHPGHIEDRGDNLYSKRFSHAYPLGIDVDDEEEMERSKAFAKRPVVEQMQPEEQVDVEESWYEKRWDAVNRWIRYPAWRYILTCAVFVGFIILWAWHQMKSRGCGDQCLDKSA
jgi:hypothetical protein